MRLKGKKKEKRKKKRRDIVVVFVVVVVVVEGIKSMRNARSRRALKTRRIDGETA